MDSDAGAYPYPPEGGGHHLLAFLALSLLLVIAAAGGAFATYIVLSRSEESRLDSIRRSIFKAVRKSLDKALKARGPQLVMAADALMVVANQQLGPFMGSNRAILSPLDALARGLTGKTSEGLTPAPPASAVAPTPAGLAASAAPAGGAPASTTPGKDNTTAVVVTPAVITNINVIDGRGGGSDGKPAPAPPPGPPAKPPDRDMFITEQLEALSKALESFDRVWKEDKVLPFLKAAQEALLKSRSSDDDRHDDHH